MAIQCAVLHSHLAGNPRFNQVTSGARRRTYFCVMPALTLHVSICSRIRLHRRVMIQSSENEMFRKIMKTFAIVKIMLRMSMLLCYTFVI